MHRDTVFFCTFMCTERRAATSEYRTWNFAIERVWCVELHFFINIRNFVIRLGYASNIYEFEAHIMLRCC